MHLILQIGISRDTECVNTAGFPKSGHICHISISVYIYAHKVMFLSVTVNLTHSSINDFLTKHHRYSYT